MHRMEVVMASELAQLGSQTADTPQPETEPEKEDVDFKFNGSIRQNQCYRHHHPEIHPQMRRMSSSLISRAPTKRKTRAVMKNGIQSQNGSSRKKNGR